MAGVTAIHSQVTWLDLRHLCDVTNYDNNYYNYYMGGEPFASTIFLRLEGKKRTRSRYYEYQKTQNLKIYNIL